jgi:hypothetical protein
MVGITRSVVENCTDDDPVQDVEGAGNRKIGPPVYEHPDQRTGSAPSSSGGLSWPSAAAFLASAIWPGPEAATEKSSCSPGKKLKINTFSRGSRPVAGERRKFLHPVQWLDCYQEPSAEWHRQRAVGWRRYILHFSSVEPRTSGQIAPANWSVDSPIINIKSEAYVLI